MLTAGCTAQAHHRHAPSPTKVGMHTNGVKAWVWINGHYTMGHWVRAHWELSLINPVLLNKHPHRYVRHTKGSHKAPPHPRRHHRRHR
jgi:hypothetical protein